MLTDRQTRGVGEQLPLKVNLRDEATFDTFLARPGQEAAVAALIALAAGECEQSVFLQGGGDSGRSHLLQATCHACEGISLYLPLGQLRDFPADQVLADVEGVALIAVDDIHLVAGLSGWERALFSAFNAAHARGTRMLFSANTAPNALSLELADLQSRLEWGPVFRLPALTEADKGSVFAFRARQRGLRLTPEAVEYVMRRAPRDMTSLLALLDTLDKASLAQQRSLSVPFIRDALGW